MLPEGVTSELFSNPDTDGFLGFTITINDNESEEWKRFGVAHQIAHFQLHRTRPTNKLLGTERFTCRLKKADDVGYRDRLNNSLEQQADRLANQLVIPGQRLAEYQRDKGIIDPNQLASAFGVPVVVVKRRMLPKE